MKKTWQYFKEILKTTAKVTLIAGATYFFAAPFALGFTATLFNAMTAGQIAGAIVTCLGGYAALKTGINDIVTMKERVDKKQREKHVDKELNDLKKGIKKITPKKNVPVVENRNQHKADQKTAPKKKMHLRKFNPFFWKKTKEYQRAA